MVRQEQSMQAAAKGLGISNNRKGRRTLVVNWALLMLGMAMSLSGLVIQCHYHLLHNPGESTVLALNRGQWNAVHVWTSIGCLFAAIGHVWVHRKWYENVLKRNLLLKHKPTLLLTILALIVVVSGLIPWLMGCFGGNPILRFSLVEIHDKVVLLFLFVAVRHTVRRRRWYFNKLSSAKQLLIHSRSKVFCLSIPFFVPLFSAF